MRTAKANVSRALAATMTPRSPSGLVISEGMVKSHLNRLLAKIGARHRAQAVAYAYQHGLV